MCVIIVFSDDYKDGIETRLQNKPSVMSQSATELPAILKIGDSTTIGDLEFTVKRAVFSDYPGNLQGYGSKDKAGVISHQVASASVCAKK